MELILPTLEPRELAKFRTSLAREDAVFLLPSELFFSSSFSQASPKLHLPLDLSSSNTNLPVIKGGTPPTI